MVRNKKGEVVDSEIEAKVVESYLKILEEDSDNYICGSREVRTNGELEYFVLEIKRGE